MSRGSRLSNAQRLPHVRSTIAYPRNCGTEQSAAIARQGIRRRYCAIGIEAGAS